MKSNPSCAVHTKKHFGVLRIIIPTVLLVLISNCALQPTLTPPNQTSFPVISNRNAAQIRLLKEWEIYDVNAITWSIDSSTFAVAGKENSDNVNLFGIYTYDINSFEKLWFSEVYVPFSLTYSPDNKSIAVPSLGLFLLNAKTGERTKEIPYQRGCIGSQEIKYNSDGTHIFTLSTDPDYRTTTISIWDVESNHCLRTIEDNGVAFDFRLSRDGSFLALGLRDIGKSLEQQVHIWNTETQKIICSFKATYHPVAFTSKGNIIAAGSIDREGDIDLWDTKTCQILDTFHQEKQKGFFSMDFSPDEKLLIVGGNFTFDIWDMVNKKIIFESGILPNPVKLLTFSPDGRYILSETDRVSFDSKAIITLWGVK